MQKWFFIPVFLLLAHFAWGQQDSLPRIVEGSFDWPRFKAQVNAPVFNQKDIVMYLVRMEGYAQLFGDNPNQDWVGGFHFLDLNRDRFLDAVFQGEVRSEEGPYVMLLMGDTTLSWEEKFASRGYFHRFSMRSDGVAFQFRRDALGAQYWSEVSGWHYDFASDSLEGLWKVVFVGNDAPVGTDRVRAMLLDAPTLLRWAPAVDDKTPVDWDGDEKADAVGNAVGVFRKGAEVLQLYEQSDGDGQRWSFVFLLNGAQELRVFPPELEVGKGPGAAYVAGWVPTKALGRR